MSSHKNKSWNKSLKHFAIYRFECSFPSCCAQRPHNSSPPAPAPRHHLPRSTAPPCVPILHAYSISASPDQRQTASVSSTMPSTSNAVLRLPQPRLVSTRAHTQKSQLVSEIERRANVNTAIAAMVDEQAKRVQVGANTRTNRHQHPANPPSHSRITWPILAVFGTRAFQASITTIVVALHAQTVSRLSNSLCVREIGSHPWEDAFFCIRYTRMSLPETLALLLQAFVTLSSPPPAHIVVTSPRSSKCNLLATRRSWANPTPSSPFRAWEGTRGGTRLHVQCALLLL